MKFLWVGLLAAYSVLVFYGSSIPGGVEPSGPSYTDKVLHFTEFFVFGFIAFKALSPSKRKKLFFTLLFALSYALLDEVHQSFVPLRGASIFDFFADAAGIFVSWFFAIRKRHYKRI